MPEIQALQTKSGEALNSGPTASLDAVSVDEEAVRAWIDKRTNEANGGTALQLPGQLPEQLPGQLPENLHELPPLDASSVLKRKSEPVALARARQVIMQEFEGRVVSISPNEGLFTAYLTDATSGSDEESEDVDLLIDDISDTDLPLFEEGAIFRWLIGYRYEGTTKERFSKLVFRRMPAWSKRQREEIWRKAKERADALKWD